MKLISRNTATTKRSTALKVLVASALAGLLLTGCTASDPLAEQFKAGDNKNYIAGDGTVTEFAKESRGRSVVWSGQISDGRILSSDAIAGTPVVMNFWYAGCAPCRAEAPDLQKLSVQFPEVQFVGVNVRDSAATAAAFERKFGVTFPSILDANSGDVVLAFTGVVTPQAVPTTLVIDKQGKVSARVLGRIDPSTLKALIQTVVKE